MKRTHTVILLAALLPLATHAGPRSELSRDIDQARDDVHAELAEERIRLERENLSLGDTLQFGKRDRATAGKARELPKAEITRTGDLLIEGKAVAIDAGQRRQLIDYRAQVIDLAHAGIDAGEKAAMVAFEATDVSMFRLIVGGLTGSLERRVQSVVQRELKPAILQICHRLPKLRDSQQALAAQVPAFRPYATLQADDVADCEADVRRDLAAR